jgi:hypothetical protein
MSCASAVVTAASSSVESRARIMTMSSGNKRDGRQINDFECRARREGRRGKGIGWC